MISSKVTKVLKEDEEEAEGLPVAEESRSVVQKTTLLVDQITTLEITIVVREEVIIPVVVEEVEVEEEE